MRQNHPKSVKDQNRLTLFIYWICSGEFVYATLSFLINCVHQISTPSSSHISLADLTLFIDSIATAILIFLPYVYVASNKRYGLLKNHPKITFLLIGLACLYKIPALPDSIIFPIISWPATLTLIILYVLGFLRVIFNIHIF